LIVVMVFAVFGAVTTANSGSRPVTAKRGYRAHSQTVTATSSEVAHSRRAADQACMAALPPRV